MDYPDAAFERRRILRSIVNAHPPTLEVER